MPDSSPSSAYTPADVALVAEVMAEAHGYCPPESRCSSHYVEAEAGLDALAASGRLLPPPVDVREAAQRLREDIRAAIDVLYGDIGGEDDTAEDVEATERAIARDMALVLDWLTAPPAEVDRSAPDA